jgi:hypothetical protein
MEDFTFFIRYLHLSTHFSFLKKESWISFHGTFKNNIDSIVHRDYNKKQFEL